MIAFPPRSSFHPRAHSTTPKWATPTPAPARAPAQIATGEKAVAEDDSQQELMRERGRRRVRTGIGGSVAEVGAWGLDEERHEVRRSKGGKRWPGEMQLRSGNWHGVEGERRGCSSGDAAEMEA